MPQNRPDETLTFDTTDAPGNASILTNFAAPQAENSVALLGEDQSFPAHNQLTLLQVMLALHR